MHDELTRKDIQKMQEELDYRTNELMPELIEEVKRTRAFGVSTHALSCYLRGLSGDGKIIEIKKRRELCA